MTASRSTATETQSPEPDAPVAARWEWRTFGDSFGAAGRRFSELVPEQVQESDELYLLSPNSDASVKVRGGLMDVKQLQKVSDDGLEQWLPTMKAAFPLSVDDVRSVLAALSVFAPSFARGQYTMEQFVDEVVHPSSELEAIEVHKRRHWYTVDDCMAELTEIRTTTGRTRTIAVESTDPGLVMSTVAELGLASRPNTSVSRGLKALTGFGGPRYAVIDVGTNSVKLYVAARRVDGSWATVVDRAEVTRLGEGLEKTGRLGRQPIERTATAVAAMVDEAKRDGALRIVAVGTAGLRIASNRETFIDAVSSRCGLRVEVIPGDEEARLAYVATKAALGLAEESLVVFDTGGGSSQFTFGHGDDIDDQFSVNVGAARYTERYGLDDVVDERRLREALDAIAADLTRLDGRARPDTLVAMGGAVTNLAAVKDELATYDAEVVQGTILERVEVERQIELYANRTAEERRAIVGLQPNRAEVILAGACIVLSALTKLGQEALTVSACGLRHGLLVELFGKAGRQQTIAG